MPSRVDKRPQGEQWWLGKRRIYAFDVGIAEHANEEKSNWTKCKDNSGNIKTIIIEHR